MTDASRPQPLGDDPQPPQRWESQAPAHSAPSGPPSPYSQPYPNQPHPGQVPFDQATPPEPAERVGTGVALAVIGILAGIALTVLLWHFGFIASIVSLLMGAGATALYTKGAGAPPKKGAIPLIALIVVGLVVAFLACVGYDLWQYYAVNAPVDAEISQMQFVWQNLFRGDVLGEYSMDMAMFALFAGLGIFGTFGTLLKARAGQQ